MGPKHVRDERGLCSERSTEKRESQETEKEKTGRGMGTVRSDGNGVKDIEVMYSSHLNLQGWGGRSLGSEREAGNMERIRREHQNGKEIRHGRPILENIFFNYSCTGNLTDEDGPKGNKKPKRLRERASRAKGSNRVYFP